MKKNIYTQPLCQVIEIELESILCDSLFGTSVTDAPDATNGPDLFKNL